MIKKGLISSDNLHPNEESILSKWLHHITHHPRFKDEDLPLNSNLKTYSRAFLKHLFSAIKSPNMPKIEADSMKPVLSLWHELLGTQQQKGFSTRETALLIYGLRSTLMEFISQQDALTRKNKDDLTSDELTQLGQLLNLLGMLTFEVYQVEQENVIERQNQQIQYLQSENSFKKHIMGQSKVMQHVFQTMGLVLENDITVLLEGESGTGKDLIASIIHENSKRKMHPFITLNCGAIPKDLIESELFGHEAGAFTGADKQRLGKFELAQNGTLFLDEISELPMDMQVKLLRVLQNKEVERLGGNQKIKLNTRIIAASNRSLKRCVDEGTFRLDLYYRLHVFPIHIPPLRDREDDVILLSQHFLKHYAEVFDLPLASLSSEAERFLRKQTWPGNVRELQNLMQRVLIIAQGSTIKVSHLDFQPSQQKMLEISASQPDSDQLFSGPIRPLEDIEKAYLLWALEKSDNNMSACAKALGLSRTTLYNKLKS